MLAAVENTKFSVKVLSDTKAPPAVKQLTEPQLAELGVYEYAVKVARIGVLFSFIEISPISGGAQRYQAGRLPKIQRVISAHDKIKPPNTGGFLNLNPGLDLGEAEARSTVLAPTSVGHEAYTKETQDHHCPCRWFRNGRN